MRIIDFLKYFLLFKWLRGRRSNVQSGSGYDRPVLHDGYGPEDNFDTRHGRVGYQKPSGMDDPKAGLFKNSGYVYDPEIFEGLEEDEYADAFRDAYGDSPFADVDDIHDFDDSSDIDFYPSDDIDDYPFDDDDFDPDW